MALLENVNAMCINNSNIAELMYTSSTQRKKWMLSLNTILRQKERDKTMTNHLIRQIRSGQLKTLNEHELAYILENAQELIDKYYAKHQWYKDTLEQTSIDISPIKHYMKAYRVNEQRLHAIQAELDRQDELENRDVYNLEAQYENCLANLEYMQEQMTKTLKQSGLDIKKPTDWQFSKWLIDTHDFTALQATIDKINKQDDLPTTKDVRPLAELIHQFYKHQIPFEWVVSS